VTDFIRPADLGTYPPPILEIQGWGPDEWSRAASPTYPCLIDTDHVVAELFRIVNVPTAVWIDEGGVIVRPVENAGNSDTFRVIDRTTFAAPPEAVAIGRQTRSAYLNAVRDWVEKGPSSVHAFPPEEVVRRLGHGDRDDRTAAVNFRLGVHLFRTGAPDAAQRYFEEAVRLRPDSWAFRRQALQLAEPGHIGEIVAGPEFWVAVDALGDDFYAAPPDMEGMPAPYKPPK
jgi:hypothetical protein